ncbi:hypothetical protein HPB48_004947 [Haemaphysalis longicornis]|uniref:Flavin-containing monooxygenase n=1 Tax=Haemaphysalis longicornis TaxID=44386 RepID=A0A9J6GCV5_HAELO|nr:hypothetical protein HPB48_004947 [Haemaphysalis longicornis]
MLDYGFDVVLYERSATIGGLWAYHDEDVDGQASVMRTTIINTSKEMSAFSDFPPPKDLPNYMHNSKMVSYFRSYADHFGVTPLVRTKHDVVQVTPAADYEETGRWEVLVRDLEANSERREKFDAVCVCVGHHVYPNVPTFKGQENFRGRIFHTHSLKNADKFRDRRVAVVGIGNSGVDAVVDASYVASELSMLVRTQGCVWERGCWPSSTRRRRRHVMSGRDELNHGRGVKARKISPSAVYEGRSPFSQHPTVNDALPNLILSGKVRVKKDIVHFTQDGVLFEGDDKVTPLDDVILATGYQIKFPFLPKDVVSVVDNHVQLYKYVFPPQLRHPTLAVIGLIQPVGAIFPISEMQSRWMGELLCKRRSLPSAEAMYENIRRKQEAMRRRYVGSPRHTIQVDWINYMDELASQIGARPQLLKYFFTDNELFRVLLGPAVPYQFRLEGPKRWAGARQAILDANQRVLYPLNDRCLPFERKGQTQTPEGKKGVCGEASWKMALRDVL